MYTVRTVTDIRRRRKHPVSLSLPEQRGVHGSSRAARFLGHILHDLGKQVLLVGIPTLVLAIGVTQIPQVQAIIGNKGTGGSPASHAGHMVSQPVANGSSLVGWWRFDGDTTDGGPNGLTVATNSNTSYGTGRFQKALNFVDSSPGPASSFIINKNSALNMGGDLTLMAWVRPTDRDSDGTSDVVIHKGGQSNTLSDFSIRYNDANGSTSFILGNGTSSTSANAAASYNLNDNEWAFLVGRVTGTSMYLYVNGIEAATATFSGSRLNNNYNVGIGTFMNTDTASTAAAQFTGLIDDVRIYSRALSVEEIAALYQTSGPPNCDQYCKGWWKLDETSGTSLTDTIAANTATATAGVTPWQGRFAGGYKFNGNEDVGINIPTSASYDTAEGTWSFWVRSALDWDTGNSDAQNRAVLMTRASSDASNGLVLLLTPAGEVTAGAVDASLTRLSITSPALISNDEWHHVALTFRQANGGQSILYIDGAQVASGSNSATWAFASQAVRLGDALTTVYEQFKGIMDDVRIYNRILEPYEVYEQYSAGRSY